MRRRVRPILRGPIARRLFIFNILIVFMPVAGFFSLSAYEDRLLADLESSLVQQGRFLAAWLQEAPLSRDRASSTVSSLGQKHTARIRVIDSRGALLADSADSAAAGMTGGIGGEANAAPTRSPTPTADSYAVARKAAEPIRRKAETTILYRALSFPVRLTRAYLSRPTAPLESADYYSGKAVFDGVEIARALSGSYGAITRISSGGQTSVTLYSAIPVMREGRAEGVVLVSQSTYRILSSLYAFRLEIGRIFVLSLFAAAIVSLILGVTISRPLARLRKEAEEAIAARAGPTGRAFSVTGRDDEIDRLSASLTALVADLGRQIALSENFASDAAHELRNRIAGIRTAAEIVAYPGEDGREAGDDRERAAALIVENASRMEGALASLRELSRIETDTEGAATDEARAVVESVAQAARARHPGIQFPVRSPDALPAIPVAAERLEIAIDNLVENAASFSPVPGEVVTEISLGKDRLTIAVTDSGPGVPEEHRDRVFGRFFSWRPEGSEPTDAPPAHAGIGLAIVEAIMRRSGGAVSCENRPEGGARFTLEFPLA